MVAVDAMLQLRLDMDQVLQRQLGMVRDRMKHVDGRGRTKREFSVGDFFYLKLQTYRQKSLALRKDFKLNPRFYGPYKVI